MTTGKTAPVKPGIRRGNDGSNGVRDHGMITQGYNRNLSRRDHYVRRPA